MEVCKVGCIACTMCTKVCPNDAIHMNGNIAEIDYEKCVGCGLCAEKCPKKIIHMFQETA
jgi:Pyruvate/2-oxoacid:ferredoxin oxidoreductase delta subunit